MTDDELAFAAAGVPQWQRAALLDPYRDEDPDTRDDGHDHAVDLYRDQLLGHDQ
ncbi:hypothetical protein ACTHQY_09070 [Rhodococcoides corynebacterioides]|uniref:hypothetical protein n=1 Tax=Rhodococcoides corynebacterioides TaxID=53972 RepID=UPI003F7F5F08